MSTNTTLMPRHAGHRERLRKRFMREPQHAEDYEVLELLLGYALTRKDTKPLAKELLARFGSLRAVLDARREELEQTPGFGPGLWALWQVVRECMARYEAAPVLEKEVLATPHAVARMAQRRLAGNSCEECWLALVDAGNRCVGWELLLRGSMDNVPVTPRDVLEMALKRRAYGFILVHNHPGGSSQASMADVVLTQELQKLAPRMGIRFLDHVIITEKDCRSLILDQCI